MNRVAAVKQAILKVLGARIGPNAKQVVQRDVYSGRADPGGWAPNAVAVIHCESGIPSCLYDEYIEGRLCGLDVWAAVSDELDGMFCEHINAAVIAVWPE